MSLDIRSRLSNLGPTPLEPPEDLRSRSSFSSKEDLASFLARVGTRSDPFWKEISASLPWIEAPSSVRAGADWFPGGKLNLAAACLEGAAAAGVFPIDSPGSPDEAIPGSALAKMVHGAARSVDTLGLAPGETIVLHSRLDASMIIGTLACLHRGLAVLPVTPGTGDRDLDGIRELARPKGLVDTTGEPPAATFDRTISIPVRPKGSEPFSPVPRDPGDPALVLAEKSGSLHTIPGAGFLVQALSAYRYLLAGKQLDTPLWICFDSRAVSFLAAALGTLADGGHLGVINAGAFPSIGQLPSVVSSRRPSRLLVDTPFLHRVTREDRQQAGFPLDLLMAEGDSIQPSQWSAARSLFEGDGPHMAQLLARPEAGGFIAGSDPLVATVNPGCAGHGAPGVSLSIVDGNGAPCLSGIGGFLALSHTCPAVSRELVAGETPLPLDVKARRDSQGRIWTLGEGRSNRPKPQGLPLMEVETFLATLPQIEQVAVVRFDDDEGVSKTRAFILPTPDAPGDVIEIIKAAIAGRHGEDAVPDSFQVVEELPRSRSGKLLRSVLRRISTGEPMGSDDVSIIAPGPTKGDDD